MANTICALQQEDLDLLTKVVIKYYQQNKNKSAEEIVQGVYNELLKYSSPEKAYLGATQVPNLLALVASQLTGGKDAKTISEAKAIEGKYRVDENIDANKQLQVINNILGVEKNPFTVINDVEVVESQLEQVRKEAVDFYYEHYASQEKLSDTLENINAILDRKELANKSLTMYRLLTMNMQKMPEYVMLNGVMMRLRNRGQFGTNDTNQNKVALQKAGYATYNFEYYNPKTNSPEYVSYSYPELLTQTVKPIDNPFGSR